MSNVRGTVSANEGSKLATFTRQLPAYMTRLYLNNHGAQDHQIRGGSRSYYYFRLCKNVAI